MPISGEDMLKMDEILGHNWQIRHKQLQKVDIGQHVDEETLIFGTRRGKSYNMWKQMVEIQAKQITHGDRWVHKLKLGITNLKRPIRKFKYIETE